MPWEARAFVDGLGAEGRRSFNVDAVENRAALRAAQAAEETYRALMEQLRALGYGVNDDTGG